MGTIMAKPTNRVVRNRTSPRNEQEYREVYKQVNQASKKEDDLDIVAVITKDGTPGHALLNQSINRGKDKQYHIGKAFVSDAGLKKVMKGQK